jgi:hypothetical protein
MDVGRILHKWLNKGVALFGVVFWYSGTLANAPMLYAFSAAVLAFKVSGTIYAKLAATGLAIDNLIELTAANGILIDGVRLRDGAVQTKVDASAATAAAGTDSTNAGVLPAGTAGIYQTSGADGTKGVRINAADAVPGRTIVVTNPVAAVLKVYPPTGGAINAGATDAALSSTSGRSVTLTCVTATTWAA